jgi:hypothetical protein
MEKEGSPVKLCVLPDGLPALRNFPDVHSSLHFLVVSGPSRPRPTTHAVSSRSEADAGDAFEVVEVSPGEIRVCGYLAIDAPQHPATNEALSKLLSESDRERIGHELAIYIRSPFFDDETCGQPSAKSNL